MTNAILKALQQLTATCIPADCGGFTLDDIKSAMRNPFEDDRAFDEPLEQLQRERLVRIVGEDGEETCYALR